MQVKLLEVRWVKRVSMATAEPERDSPRAYKVKKANPAIRVFIEPIKIRKVFLETSENWELIRAAWFVPKAGIKTQRGAERIEIKEVSWISLKEIFGLEIVCFLILSFRDKEDISEGIANSPESRGRRDWFKGRDIVARPRKEERIKINRESLEKSL